MVFQCQPFTGSKPLVSAPKSMWMFLISFRFHILGEQSGEYRDLNYAGASSGVESHPNGSLTIHKVQQEHGGYFLCQASNGIGTDLSKLIQLTVHGEYESGFKPKFLLEFS